MSGRGLVVLADGAQVAFCAGVVAELASAGQGWSEGAGAGLGAQVALLALVGEAEEAARRYQRLAEERAALLRPALVYLRDAVAHEGFLLLPDPYRLTGWLWTKALAEYLAPDVPLVGRAKLWLAMEDLKAGVREWRQARSGEDVAAAAAFPWGWPPVGEIWGGVGACAELPPPPLGVGGVDLVCGFPVPPEERPGLGCFLFATVQRREEIAAARTVVRWVEANAGTRVFAPSQEAYRAFAQRDGALVGVEYPLPVECNGQLMPHLVAFGRFVAKAKGG